MKPTNACQRNSIEMTLLPVQEKNSCTLCLVGMRWRRFPAETRFIPQIGPLIGCRAASISIYRWHEGSIKVYYICLKVYQQPTGS